MPESEKLNYCWSKQKLILFVWRPKNSTSTVNIYRMSLNYPGNSNETIFLNKVSFVEYCWISECGRLEKCPNVEETFQIIQAKYFHQELVHFCWHFQPSKRWDQWREKKNSYPEHINSRLFVCLTTNPNDDVSHSRTPNMAVTLVVVVVVFLLVFVYFSFGYNMALAVFSSDAAAAVAGFHAFESITCTKPFDIIWKRTIPNVEHESKIRTTHIPT